MAHIGLGSPPHAPRPAIVRPAPLWMQDAVRRTLLDYLEAHVERLQEELAEARTEMCGVRYEAESLRVEAGRAQVFAALVEAERARLAEIRAERDRLVVELAEWRRGWLARVVRAF